MQIFTRMVDSDANSQRLAKQVTDADIINALDKVGLTPKTIPRPSIVHFFREIPTRPSLAADVCVLTTTEEFFIYTGLTWQLVNIDESE